MLRIDESIVADLDRFVDEFECAHAAELAPAVEDFLPVPSHPHYAAIVGELLRVDLELSWQRGARLTLDNYRSRFADVLADSHRLQALAFEEYRMRRQAGDAVTPEEYRDRYGIDTTDWPTARRSDSGRLVEFDERMPAPNGHERSASRFSGRELDVSDVADVQRAFPNFMVVEELGRGSFGCVFLARDRALANRMIALKVSQGASVEPERLAQLQHANIVPIYSVHQTAGLQAVCMPYLGRCTVADILGRLRRQSVTPQSGIDLLSTIVARDDSTVAVVPDQQSSHPSKLADHDGRIGIVPSIRDHLERSTYVDAVVWMGAQMAAGLAHAHERGILHRDLKPANVLLADDGRPMLLDFNLSDRMRAPTERAALVGGTLPYMAPEHLEALETGVGIDARSDVYALGVVLFELLTRRLPFEADCSGKAHAASLAAQRRDAAPSARKLNPWIPRSVDAILARCLAARPADRYQSAEEMREDLERHLANQPLKYASDRHILERIAKWSRRHPRLSSAVSLGSLATLIIAGVVAAWIVREHRVALIETRSNYQAFVDAVPSVQAPLSVPGVDAEALDNGIRAGLGQLDRFDVQGDADWRSGPAYALLAPHEQSDVDGRLVITLYLLASAHQRRAVAAVTSKDRESALQQASTFNASAIEISERRATHLHGAVDRQRQELTAELSGKTAAASTDRELQSPTSDAELEAIELLAKGRHGEALPRLIEWRDRSPNDVSAWLLLGNAYAGIGNPSEAEECYTVGVVQRPEFAYSYFLRGLARYELHKYQGAVDDFNTVLKLGGCPTAARINRALALYGANDLDGALADLDSVLELPGAPTRLYFIRAQVRQGLGDATGAMRDFQQGLRETPQDATSWLVRGMAALRSNPDRALADFRRAHELDPGSRQAMQNIVHALADKLGREKEALPFLDAILAADPRDVRALASRAVVRARLGDHTAAMADADIVLSLSEEPKLLLQAACVYAICAGDDDAISEKALKLLARAVGADSSLVEIAVADEDLESLRKNAAFERILDSARVLLNGGSGSTTEQSDFLERR